MGSSFRTKLRQNKERTERLKAQGLCICCGKRKVAEGKIKCKKCLKQLKINYLKRKKMWKVKTNKPLIYIIMFLFLISIVIADNIQIDYGSSGEIIIISISGKEIGFFSHNLTEEIIVIPPSGGAPGLEISRTECKWNITPKNIFFNVDNLNNYLNITNYGEFDAFIQVFKTYIPTVFGARDLLEIEKENFYLQNEESILFNVNLKDIRLIRENTTTSLQFKAGENCIKDIPIYISQVPAIFYDVKIQTEKDFLYIAGSIVKMKITLINKGDFPDKDTILKLYIINPDKNKEYFYEEKLFEIDVGETILEKEYFLSLDAKNGKYTIGVEYETEEQGLLRAEDSFYVVSPLTLLFTKLSFYASGFIVVVIIVLLIFLPRKKEVKKEE